MIQQLCQTIKIAPPSTVEGVLQNQFVYGGSCGLGLSVLLCSGLITYAGVATSNPYFTWAGIGFVLAGLALCWCIGALSAARAEAHSRLGTLRGSGQVQCADVRAVHCQAGLYA